MSKNEVIVLQSGYCKPHTDGKSFIADGSVTLIKSSDCGYILVDTSGPWRKQLLLNDIESQGISVDDIKTVVCTHGHSDHTGNLNIFSPTCKIIVGFDISCGNVYEDFDFNADPCFKLSDHIDVIATPGHMHSDVSVVVRNTDQGTIVVAGDLFENEDDLLDESIWRANSENPEMQKINRTKVLNIADYIVPGHGKMFAVKK